jgi:Uma2 family endonuclease
MEDDRGNSPPREEELMATDLATQVTTPEQLAAMPNDKDFELVEGQLVERKMGNKSNWIATRLATLMMVHVDQLALGWVFTSEAGYRLNPSRPNTVRKPDVSFVAAGRLPDEEPADAYDRLAPDLAAEVISPGDTVRELDEKVEEYLRAGVRLVWVINPDLQVVRVFRPEGTIETLRFDDELDAGEVVPGFRCQVSALFKRPVPRKTE